jgi:hypothetical protein
VVYVIGGRETVLFPLPEEQFTVLAKTFPCFNLQGIRWQDIEINMLIDVENRQTGKKFANSLLFSLDCTPCVRPKNWEQVNQHIQQQYAGVKE